VPIIATFVGLVVYVAFGDNLKGRDLTPDIAFAVNSIVSLCMKPIFNLFIAIKSLSGLISLLLSHTRLEN
jgi:hypothetical protein